nr:hypothetical protein [Tanacetum cinerariifolium]
MDSEVPKFLADKKVGKRYKTSRSSSFNIESGDASVNLNVDDGDDEEYKVHEVKRRPIVRDKAKILNKKWVRSLGTSSTMNEEALARLMVSEMAIDGELMSVLNSGIRENLSTTLVNLPTEDDYSPLLAYVVWIFVAYLTYPVIPPYLHPFMNEDTIFDPGITVNSVYSFKPGSSHWHGAFRKFNTHRIEEIEDDNLREKLFNVHLLIANIEALKDNPTQSSEILTKSSFTSLNSFLEETSTFHNSLPEFENFYFDLGEISSGSPTTHSDISLPDYEAFYFDDDHIKEISSGSTTTHSDISLSEYDSFIFEEFVDELAHIISPPEYDCFYFKDLPNPGELMSVLNSGICENLLSTTLVNLPTEDDYSPLLAYVVWIFLAYLTHPVIPPYLHPFGNEDTIFDPCITINHFYSCEPVLSHRHGAFKKFNTHRSHLNEWPMIINGKNTPLLDVLMFHFYPP